MIVRVSLSGAEAALRRIARTWPQALVADLERELASQPRPSDQASRASALAAAIAQLRGGFPSP